MRIDRIAPIAATTKSQKRSASCQDLILASIRPGPELKLEFKTRLEPKLPQTHLSRFASATIMTGHYQTFIGESVAATQHTKSRRSFYFEKILT